MTSCVSTLTSRSVFSPVRLGTVGGVVWLASAGGWVLDGGTADLSGVPAAGVFPVVGAGLGTGFTTKGCPRERGRKHRRIAIRTRFSIRHFTRIAALRARDRSLPYTGDGNAPGAGRRARRPGRRRAGQSLPRRSPHRKGETGTSP